MTTLISTYLSLSTPNRTILTVPAGIFVCTFPEIPVQTWCKGVSMIAGGFLVSPHQHHSESPKPALNVNSSCATSSPAEPARAQNLADTLAQHHAAAIIDNLATGPAGRRSSTSSPGDVCRGSITDLDLLMETFPGADGIFHQAAIPSVPRSVIEPPRLE